MIYFARSPYLVIVGSVPDGTDPANFPKKTALRYDVIAWVDNNVALQTGDTLPLDKLQPDPEALPHLYLHVTTSGGDGRTPRGYNLDTPTPITVHVELHANVTNPYAPGETLDIIVPVTGEWRIPFGGSSYLSREVTLTNGVADFQLIDIPEGVFYPEVNLFDKIEYNGQRYEVEIVGDARFTGFRAAPKVIA